MFRRQWTADAHAAIDRADRPERNKDSVVAVSTHAVRLTKAEAHELSGEINDLIDGLAGEGPEGEDGGEPTRCSGCSSPRPSAVGEP